jgi:aminoglycoside 3-N-acetyltransferase
MDLFANEKGRVISSKDFLDASKKLGIRKGDKLFVHSDISVFGRLTNLNRDELLGGLIDLFKQAVGSDGLIVMPTFTYDFCKGQVYDIEKSRSTVGILTEFFRKTPGVVRTLDPIHSAAVWGKDKEKIAKVGKDTFGVKSIFDNFHKAKGKIVIFGAPFQSATVVHYIEQIYGVPYRFQKVFSGTITDGSKSWKDEYKFNVRYLDKPVNIDTSRLEKYLTKNKFLKKAKVGNGSIMVIKSSDLFRESVKLLNKDIHYFLKKGELDEYEKRNKK